MKRTLEWSKSLFSERKGIWATDRRAFERRDKGVLEKLRGLQDLAIRSNLSFPPDTLITQIHNLAFPVLRSPGDADSTAMEDEEV